MNSFVLGESCDRRSPVQRERRVLILSFGGGTGDFGLNQWMNNSTRFDGTGALEMPIERTDQASQGAFAHAHSRGRHRSNYAGAVSYDEASALDEGARGPEIPGLPESSGLWVGLKS